jgi:hypothetical protein
MSAVPRIPHAPQDQTVGTSTDLLTYVVRVPLRQLLCPGALKLAPNVRLIVHTPRSANPVAVQAQILLAMRRQLSQDVYRFGRGMHA